MFDRTCRTFEGKSAGESDSQVAEHPLWTWEKSKPRFLILSIVPMIWWNAMHFLEPLPKKARDAPRSGRALCDFFAEFVAVVGDVGYQELGRVAAEAEDLAYQVADTLVAALEKDHDRGPSTA